MVLDGASRNAAAPAAAPSPTLVAAPEEPSLLQLGQTRNPAAAPPAKPSMPNRIRRPGSGTVTFRIADRTADCSPREVRTVTPSVLVATRCPRVADASRRCTATRVPGAR